MSEKYLPLFRKYRPQSFKDVVGQENLIKALSNAIELNKIANAYLFAGPRGTGKTSTARIFAKSLNCVNGPTLVPCQNCPSCLDITNASGLDVIEIDAATNRGIDDAKELIAQVQYAPMNGKYKIFIIDEVHMLSNEAFNALLKTFEEPPANVIFILATTEPHKVIETIVSRCQRFDLRRITTEDIVKRLREISDLENIKITDDALNTIARNVSGGLRDSLALLDQVSILGVKEEIQKEDIENLLGKVTFDVSFNFLNKVISKNINETLVLLDTIYNKGLEPKNFCENFIEFLRNLIFALESNDIQGSSKFTNFNASDVEKIKAQNLDKARVFNILDRVIEYYKEIRFTTNPYLWAELMVINLCKDETPAAPSMVSSMISPVVQAAPAAQNVIQNNAPDIISEAKKTSEIIQNAPLENSSPVIKSASLEAAPPEIHSVPDEAPSMVMETLKEIDIPDVPHQVQNNANTDNVQNTDRAPKMPDVPTENKDVSPKMPDVPVEFPDIKANPQTVEPPKADTQANPAQAGNINPAAAWGNILSIIESIPAKFFYSGVGKLVGIEGNRLVIGFVNENAINQAKSDSKFKHLEKAVKTVLGDSVYPDFVLITNDTKVIEVKLNAPPPVQKPLPPQRQNYGGQNETPKAPVQKPVETIQKQAENPSMPDVPTAPPKDNAKENKAQEALYGAKTREMLKEFNGRVID